MKTIDNLRKQLSVVIFSAMFLVSAVEANAQNRWKSEKHERERKEYRERDNDDDRTAYNHRDGRDYGYERKNWNKHNDCREYRPGYNNRYKHGYYEHPRYGRVYQRFDCNPVVFHHDHDNYYYYGDHFYTYRRGIGYCVTEPPRHVYFRTLPVDCERVHVNGHIFFRNGDLFFQLSPRGYAIVPAPVGIRISARF